MKVLIYIHGHIHQGLDSPTAGEGTWAMNVAKMLAKYGHEVDCIAGSQVNPPSWGDSVKPDNVSLSCILNPKKEYDLVFYTPWENIFVRRYYGQRSSCLDLPIRSKWFVHCSFSWSDSITLDRDCWKQNHVLAYPYVQGSEQFPETGEKNGFKTFPIPIPIYEDLAEEKLSGRKDIFWTCKGVFHPDWPEDHYILPMGISALRALKRVSDKNGNPTIRFLDGRYFRESSHAKRLGVMDIVDTIPGAILIDKWIPKSDFLSLLGRSRVTVTLAGMLGSFGESISRGSVPLCFDGHIYRDSASKFDLKLDTYSATEEDIYSSISKLYTDDNFYRQVISSYQDEMKYYKTDIVYHDYFLPMVKELGLL